MQKAEPMRKILAILIASAFATAPVYAVKIADVTRIDGQRTNKLTGIGLVTGLKGTGDGGDYLPAIRPLAVMLGAFSNETEVRELGDVQNIALVGLSVTLPKDGVHIGDQLDVQVTSWGKATSLKNGSLVNCPMMGPKPEPNGKLWAMAQGLVVVDDPTSPTSGVIKGGCTVERSLQMQYIFNGKLKLFLEDAHASWLRRSGERRHEQLAGDHPCLSRLQNGVRWLSYRVLPHRGRRVPRASRRSRCLPEGVERAC